MALFYGALNGTEDCVVEPSTPFRMGQDEESGLQARYGKALETGLFLFHRPWAAFGAGAAG